MSDPIHIISLGAGVQSSTMALMAARGLITPMPKAAIFADTQDEPAAVYDWLAWLEKQLPFPVHRGTIGRLSDLATRVRTSKKTGMTYVKPNLPVFMDREEKKGMMPRHCTFDAKIAVLRRMTKRLAGRGNRAVVWIGISTDEIARMKDSNDPRIDHRHPLIEMNWSRQQCLDWWKAEGLPTPPRSACIYCPHHSNAEWRNLTPEQFRFACEFEHRLQATFRKVPRLTGVPYLHPSRKPLHLVDLSEKDDVNNKFLNDCQGMCGV